MYVMWHDRCKVSYTIIARLFASKRIITLARISCSNSLFIHKQLNPFSNQTLHFNFNKALFFLSDCKNSVATVGGNAHGACCKFPFIYKGAVYWRCTAQNAVKKWCSITKVFALDRRWGYCPW